MSMTWDFILRLFVAGALGTVIGLDREYRAKEAGYRTHFLVSLGSALIMIVSQYGFMEVVKMEGIDLDPSRVAAQVVSGIGFIGAGTIIFQKQIVRGLTTAAGIWATSGIGLAIGAGMYWLGISALKSIVGLTPVDFVCEMRIKRAAQLIEKSEYSFSQIAYMTGFNDPKYFSRRFKKIMGVTPTEYKERKGDAS